MPKIPPILTLFFCSGAWAQTASPALKLTLAEAMERARVVSPQIFAANSASLVAREDTVQAKAALLPNANWFNQFIYTQPNGTPSGVYVANDGPRVYTNQGIVHGDIYAPGKRADYHRAIAAEAVARAKADVAARGLIATVAQSYYAMVSGARKHANAGQSLREAQQFADVTEKQQRAGEVAHSDVIKAQIQLEQRQRDVQEAQLALDKARIGLAVLLFPDYRQDFTVVDDLETTPPLPPFSDVQALAGKNSPDIRAAQAAIQQQTYELKSARAAYLPSLSLDYFFGLNSNEYAIHNREGMNNLGSVVQTQLTVPVWTWGATRSKVKQSEIRLAQARNDLSFTQRQLLAELDAFYREADVSSFQLSILRHSMEISAESLKLTLLRYEAGEGIGHRGGGCPDHAGAGAQRL